MLRSSPPHPLSSRLKKQPAEKRILFLTSILPVRRQGAFYFKNRRSSSVDAERAFRFVPACAARLQFAAHPFPRSAPLLRQLAFGKQCSDEADSRVAGSQRLLYHSEYLFASGLLVKGFFGRSHAERPRNGFKSAKWGLNEYDFSPKLSIFSSVFSLLNFSISFSA